MDQSQFDVLAKTVGDAASRRNALRLVAGIAGGALTALVGLPSQEAGEAEKRKRGGQKRRKQKQNKKRNKTQKRDRKRARRRERGQTPSPQTPESPPPPPCAEGMTLCDGACIPDDQCCTDPDCPGNQVCRAGTCGAPSLYPNLRTLPVSDLRFDMHPDEDKATQHILRFANTVWNAGEGRLELESDVDSTERPKPIYQNLYDAPVGGTQTERRLVAGDMIYHPQHRHFHFADFAEYLLLARDATGTYRRMKTEGIKTSFCIMDTERIEGDHPGQYTTCNADRQGLSAGWADTYLAMLYDQWIVLGDQRLADGEYAVQSIADPKGLLNEGGRARETDNTAITYFTVDGDTIRNVRDHP